MGCQVSFIEPRISFMGGESPDAIGYRVSSGTDGGSTVVECKVSRSDFLADRKKPHRKEGGMGRWRYLMCPDGMVKPEEMAPGWGLLYVAPKKHILRVSGPASIKPAWGEKYEASLAAFSHEHDALRETLMLANLLHRLGNPGDMNTRLRVAEASARKSEERIAELGQRVRDLTYENWTLANKSVAA